MGKQNKQERFDNMLKLKRYLKPYIALFLGAKAGQNVRGGQGHD